MCAPPSSHECDFLEIIPMQQEDLLLHKVEVNAYQ